VARAVVGRNQEDGGEGERRDQAAMNTSCHDFKSAR
jgi:hypothetical protein